MAPFPLIDPMAPAPMALAPPSLDMVEHALLLIGRTHKARPAAAQAAHEELTRWRAMGPAHAQAIETAQGLWDGTDGSGLKESVPMPRSQAQVQQARRRALGVLGLGGLAALLAGGGRWYRAQPVLQVALSTGHAQLLERTLPDGTVLNLAARTAGTVSYFRDRRDIRLDHGEIRFAVAPDASKPFTVTTEWGRVRVLGTTFSVSARDGRMKVAVAQGRVAVWPGGQGGVPVEMEGIPAATLGAGEAVEADARGMGRQTTIPAADIGAWRQGWLVFDNTALPEAVARWNDYLPQPLRLGAAPGLQALRLSGSFPLRNPQAFLNGLPDMLPVRVVRAPGGDHSIELR